MATANQLLSTLAHHIGKGNGINVKRLADMLSSSPRHVRKLVSELRGTGHAVCGTPTDGYYIAATADELQHTCAFLRRRAMHSLILESRLMKIPLADLIGQLHLPT